MKITQMNKPVMRQLNKKQRNNYRMLSVASELMLISFDRIKSENKNNSLKVSENYRNAEEALKVVAEFSENILEIVFKDEKISSTTTFNDVVNKIDTIIRKNFD